MVTKVEVVEKERNLLRALNWLKESGLQIGEDFAWYREMRTPDAPLLRFTFVDRFADTAVLLVLKYS